VAGELQGYTVPAAVIFWCDKLQHGSLSGLKSAPEANISLFNDIGAN
jgi:hypothetical protein